MTTDTWGLVTAAQHGDTDAFRALYRTHASLVLGYARRRVNDRHLAEDLTSETFLRALRHLDTVTYQGPGFEAWLVRICRNLILDHVKSSRCRHEIPWGPENLRGLTDSGTTPSTEDTLLDAIETREREDLAARVWRAVAELAPAQRQCIELRFAQGLSTGQTATVMGQSVPATKSVQHRGLETLRRRLVAA